MGLNSLGMTGRIASDGHLGSLLLEAEAVAAMVVPGGRVWVGT